MSHLLTVIYLKPILIITKSEGDNTGPCVNQFPDSGDFIRSLGPFPRKNIIVIDA